MIITIKLQEIVDKDKWLSFCDRFGIDMFSLTKGTLNPDDEWTMTVEQAREIGLI